MNEIKNKTKQTAPIECSYSSLKTKLEGPSHSFGHHHPCRLAVCKSHFKLNPTFLQEKMQSRINGARFLGELCPPAMGPRPLHTARSKAQASSMGQSHNKNFFYVISRINEQIRRFEATVDLDFLFDVLPVVNDDKIRATKCLK